MLNPHHPPSPRRPPASLGVIGSGPLGIAIAEHADRDGLRVVLSDIRVVAELRARVEEIGGTARAGTPTEAAATDVVVLAVTFAEVPEVGTRVGDWSGRTVIDATSPTDDELRPSETTDSEWVHGHLPGAVLVKAFNAIPARFVAGNPRHRSGHRAIFFAGDDATANDVVAEMIQRFGFAPIDVGLLRDGGRLIQRGGHLHGLVALAQD